MIPGHEWAVLAAGLTQRARAIEAYLRDVNGPAAIVSDGVMAEEVFTGCDAWRPEGRLLPDDVMRAPVIGFDLVRDSIEGWRVLEDNARVPSGIGYAIAVRRLMSRVMPEFVGCVTKRKAEDALALIGRTLRACAPVEDAVVALLSEGADNSGWYEHRLIAEEVGLLLAQPSEVEVRGGRVVVGGRPVDVVYLRLGCELIDLTDARGRPVGAQVLEVAQQGGVVVVNAPGNGIADDKAMYCFVPDLIAYYLSERPLLAPVPTYRCVGPRGVRGGARPARRAGDQAGGWLRRQWRAHRAGGHARRSSTSRRREILETPAAWVAQEVVALSTLPTFVDGRMEPRHVDLRAFVYLTGTGAGEAELAGSGPDPGGTRRQHGRQLLAGRWRQGHLDPGRPRRRRGRGHRCADSAVSVRFDGRPPDADALQRSCQVMACRGPDGSGLWVRGPVGLGHRRLSIIDLSRPGVAAPGGPGLGLTVAFNGCIYNHAPAAGRAGRPGPHLLLHLGHRGDRQGLRRVGHRLRVPLPRHVRLRRRRARDGPAGAGPGPAGHQAALRLAPAPSGCGSPPPCPPWWPPATSTRPSTAWPCSTT